MKPVHISETLYGTTLDTIFLAMGLSALFSVLVFALLVLLFSKGRLRLRHIPASLDGLSECWALEDMGM